MQNSASVEPCAIRGKNGKQCILILDWEGNEEQYPSKHVLITLRENPKEKVQKEQYLRSELGCYIYIIRLISRVFSFATCYFW